MGIKINYNNRIAIKHYVNHSKSLVNHMNAMDFQRVRFATLPGVDFEVDLRPSSNSQSVNFSYGDYS